MLSDLTRPMESTSKVWQGVAEIFRRLLAVVSVSQLKSMIDLRNVETLMAMLFFENFNLLESNFEWDIAERINKVAHQGTGTLCGFMEGQTEADLSRKKLGPGGAFLVAWDL